MDISAKNRVPNPLTEVLACRTYALLASLAAVTAIVAAQPSASVLAQTNLVARTDQAGNPAQASPIDPVLKFATKCLDHSQANIRDYTAVFIKRARVDGKLSEQTYAQVKIRNRKSENGRLTVPLSVYIQFLSPDSVKGREVIWVEGRNRGRLVAHEAGFKNLLRVNLEPTGYVAMRGQRHPITEIGLENLLVKLIETGQRERRYEPPQIQFFQNAKVGDAVCTMVDVVHPTKQSYYDFFRAQIFFDNETKLPIRYVSWSWPSTAGGEPVLEEEYTYTNLKTNVGLTDQDFDPDNPSYNYP